MTKAERNIGPVEPEDLGNSPSVSPMDKEVQIEYLRRYLKQMRDLGIELGIVDQNRQPKNRNVI